MCLSEVVLYVCVWLECQFLLSRWIMFLWLALHPQAKAKVRVAHLQAELETAHSQTDQLQLSNDKLQAELAEALVCASSQSVYPI